MLGYKEDKKKIRERKGKTQPLAYRKMLILIKRCMVSSLFWGSHHHLIHTLFSALNP